MRKIAVFLLITALLVPGMGLHAEAESDVKDWTFMIYLFADSVQHGGTLASYYNMVDNLKSEGGWSDENINVLVLMDRHPSHPPDGDAHVYYIEKDRAREIALSEINPDWVNEINMGDRHPIIDFGVYAITHYPAKHYVLVTRSAGWWPDNFGEDDSAGENMNVFEMRSVLSNLSHVAGKKIDIVTIAGCTSGMFEWAYDYQRFADYYVSTETYSTGSNWRIYYWIDALRKDPGMSPEELTKVIVNEYVNEDRPEYNPYNSLTASSVRMSVVDDVARALDNLSLSLMDTMPGEIHRIAMAREKIPEIDNYLRVDLREMAVQIRDAFPEDSRVHADAQELIDAVDRMVVISRWHNPPDSSGINVSSATGLSIYFIKDRNLYWQNTVDAYRTRLRLSIENHWIDFLDMYFSYHHFKDRFSVGDQDISMGTVVRDLDGDGKVDDMGVIVQDLSGSPIEGASVYLNGEFTGVTDDGGVFMDFNTRPGSYMVAVIYGDHSASAVVEVPEKEPGFEIIFEAEGCDLDGDGAEDDVWAYLHDSEMNPIPGAMVFSESGIEGWTDERGYFSGYDYSMGTHYLIAVVWEEIFTIAQFYSEGCTEGMDISYRVVDYDGSGADDDLLVELSGEGGGISGALVYLDDVYVGTTLGGKNVNMNLEEGWHTVDVYYRPPETRDDAWFEDVYVRYADLNNDTYEETLSVWYSVGLSDPAKDVKVSLQVVNWKTGSVKAVLYDNFTVIAGMHQVRCLNYSSDATRFVSLYLKLEDGNSYIMDSWERYGYWIEVPENQKPEARIFVRPTYTYVNEVVTINASTSTDIDGTVVLYFFDFGDGTNSSWINQSVVTHRYTRPGNYTVYAMVQDNLGAVDEMSNRLTIWVREQKQEDPVDARLFVRPTYTYPWEDVWLNASSSYIAEGTEVEYMFLFGDGTSSGWVKNDTVRHIYNLPGNYTTQLMIRDASGNVYQSNRITVWVREEVNKQPHAVLRLSTYHPKVNESVEFNASASYDKDGSVYRYLFDFGDGTDSGWVMHSTVHHSYAARGEYTVRVMVEDDRGLRSQWSTPKTVDVSGNDLPRPYLFARPHTVEVGGAVVLNASGSHDPDGSIAAYLFDFGDGTTSGWTEYSTVEHTYSKPGTYIVQVRVRDNTGQESRYTSRTTVTAVTPEVKESEKQTVSAAVILLFVALMIAGSWYELRGRKMKMVYQPPEGEAQVKDEEKRAEEETRTEPERRVVRVKCSGCGSVIEVEKGEGPTRVKCSRCGKEGVIR